MQRWDALAVMIVCDSRGARQRSTHRATAVSMVTTSKERPRSSAVSARFIEDRSIFGGRAAGVPGLRPFSVDSSRGSPLSHAQARVLVRSKEAPELRIV